MNLSFHIDFDGRCKQAFEYYAEHLAGEIGFMLLVKDSPVSASLPESRKNDVVHASIALADMTIVGADVAIEEYKKPNGFYLLLGVETTEQVHSIYEALNVGGSTVMEPQQTFWSPCYSVVVDQFGVPWKINCAAIQGV